MSNSDACQPSDASKGYLVQIGEKVRGEWMVRQMLRITVAEQGGDEPKDLTCSSQLV